MTGLSVDTLRAWERRYQVVSPTRSPHGRLYGDAEVQRFTRLRRVVGSGYSIGQAAALSEKELDAIASSPVAVADPISTEATLELIFAAVKSFESGTIDDELGRLAAILSPADFVQRVALPLMRETGDRWHAGTLRTSQEHMVTESIRNLLGAMLRLCRPAEGRTRILAATPATELHSVGILAGCLLAAGRGFPVACLGANLPADEILFAAERTHPQVILLGITTKQPLPAAVETVRELAQSLPAETELWMGGEGARFVRDAAGASAAVLLQDFYAMDERLSCLPGAAA